MRTSSLLILILAACGGGGSDGELERLLDDVEIECGTLEFGFGQTCPDTAAALQCFDGANAAPHITQVFTTDEGDPIFEHFFIEDGSIVLVRDTREDGFGPQEITRTECSVISAIEAGDACEHVVCE